jgi:signal transduction histidine kinase
MRPPSEATLVTSEASDESEFVLATESPTSAQRLSTLVAAAIIFTIFGLTLTIGLTAPFARRVVRIDGFVPALTAVFFINDLITAALLFGQFSIIRSRALLVLADGYLYTALMAIPFALTFPGAFSATGLLGASVQSSAWIYNFWHYGFPVVTIVYAVLRGERRINGVSGDSTRCAISWNVVIVISVVCGLTWFAAARDEFLPSLMLDAIHPGPLARTVTLLNTFICVIALVFLYSRQRSVLDLWIMVVLCVWITELALLDVLLFSRFTFGFYAGRGLSLLTSVVVLVVLLVEMTRLYARLARSNKSLQRERDNRLMSLEAMASSIAHEVRQPLSIVTINGYVGLRLLAQASPNIEEVRLAMNTMVTESNHINEVFNSIRALFGHPDQDKQAVDMNQIIRGVLGSLEAELKRRGIAVSTELRSELPLVMGHRGQLKEVLLNLIRNAIEAMDAVKGGGRVLRVKTENHGDDAIAVSVADSGPGIDPRKMGGIFDAFVTTKSEGMGLGLAICRMIVERHRGELSVSPDNTSGAVFKFSLPIKAPPALP